MDINVLVGKTLAAVNVDGDQRIEFITDDGDTYAMFHSQDCCESVSIEDISGDVSDLVGVTILLAEESSNDNFDPLRGGESQTWTFYRFRTIKGSVDIRWYGQSNGYYSESVDFELVKRRF